MYKGVGLHALAIQLTLLAMLGLAPMVSNRFTNSRFLILQANMRAVSPYYTITQS